MVKYDPPPLPVPAHIFPVLVPRLRPWCSWTVWRFLWDHFEDRRPTAEAIEQDDRAAPSATGTVRWAGRRPAGAWVAKGGATNSN